MCKLNNEMRKYKQSNVRMAVMVGLNETVAPTLIYRKLRAANNQILFAVQGQGLLDSDNTTVSVDATRPKAFNDPGRVPLHPTIRFFGYEG